MSEHLVPIELTDDELAAVSGGRNEYRSSFNTVGGSNVGNFGSGNIHGNATNSNNNSFNVSNSGNNSGNVSNSANNSFNS